MSRSRVYDKDPYNKYFEILTFPIDLDIELQLRFTYNKMRIDHTENSIAQVISLITITTESQKI